MRTWERLKQYFIGKYVEATLADPNVIKKESYDFWHSNGAPVHLRWALLGNEQRETGFNYKAVGDHDAAGQGRAFGIAQWWLPRILVIRDGVPEAGVPGTGIDVRSAGHKGQLAAMLWEMTKSPEYGYIWAKLLLTKTVEEAIRILIWEYEKPKNKDRDFTKQVGFAQDLQAAHGDWDAQKAPPIVVAVPPQGMAQTGKTPLPTPTAAEKPLRASAAFPATITNAGKFPVVYDPCPHFEMDILPDSPRTGVLHTTEGNWKGAMGVFKQHFAPHFLVGRNTAGKVQISQLVPIGKIGAALRKNNNLAIVQIELVGSSQKTVWMPEPEVAEALAALFATLRDVYGIPLSYPWKVGDYGEYGPNEHRKAGLYGKRAGWLGHGDIPSPDVHWDPGALNWTKLFALAEQIKPSGSGVKPSAPETAMKETAPQKETKMNLGHNPAGAVLGNVNILAGLVNTFKNLGTSIIASEKVVAAPNVTPKTPQGVTISSIGEDFTDAKAAGQEIIEIAEDFAKRDLKGGADDVIDFCKIVFHALDRHGLNVPVVTDVVASLPDLDPAS